MPEADPTSFVPPQHSAEGLEPGKSAWARPSGTSPNWASWSGFSSPEPASPAAQQTDTPSAAADWNAWSNAVIACWVQFFSGLPQLIEITDGLLVVSWIAIVMASRNPLVVLG